MSFTDESPQPLRQQLSAERLRVLWRVERRRQFRCQIITAALYTHRHGQELRVFLGAEDANDLLHSELARFDFATLEEKAAALREVLIQKEWRDVAHS